MSATISHRASAESARSRPAPSDSRPPLRVAPEVARRRVRARILVWAAIVVTVASLFALVQFHVMAAQAAFTLQKVSQDRVNEQRRYERLREEVAASSSAPAVMAAARALGMVEAGSMTYLNAPDAAPAATTPDTVPAALSPQSYDRTKGHLDDSP